MEKLLNNFKISYTKGDTYAIAVKLKKITSDISSAYFTVKENPEDEPLIQKSLGAGISKIDDREYKQEKTYKIQLQSEDTANLEPLVQYLYDFRVAVGNVIKTVLSGVFVVNHSVSELSTTNTSTIEVTIDDVVESEVSTTPATSGIEYENDPVACAKIGDLTGLRTSAKETVVQAINEVREAEVINSQAIGYILAGTQVVPKATEATTALNARDAVNATNAEKAAKAENATNAENATKATGDKNGTDIADNYVRLIPLVTPDTAEKAFGDSGRLSYALNSTEYDGELVLVFGTFRAYWEYNVCFLIQNKYGSAARQTYYIPEIVGDDDSAYGSVNIEAKIFNGELLIYAYKNLGTVQQQQAAADCHFKLLSCYKILNSNK